MTEKMITWGDLAQRFIVPGLLTLISIVGTRMATELSSMRQEIQGLQIEVAMLKTELRLHREQERD